MGQFLLQYPKDIMQKGSQAGADGKSVSAVLFNFQNWDKGQLIPAGLVWLYMPLIIENTTGAQYEHTELGRFGKAFTNSASDVTSSAFNAIQNGSVSGISDIFNKITTGLNGGQEGLFETFTNSLSDVYGAFTGTMNQRGVGELAAGAISSKLNDGNSKMGAAIEYSTKKILNPYMTLMFRGMDFRSFNFSFNFTPKSEAESQEIYEIIKLFRKAQHPESEGFSFLKYPMQIEIIFYNSLIGQNKWLHRFKPCVINSISINSSGAGFYAPMRNGFPAETIMNIQFTENEILNRQDIEDGY